VTWVFSDQSATVKQMVSACLLGVALWKILCYSVLFFCCKDHNQHDKNVTNVDNFNKDIVPRAVLDFCEKRFSISKKKNIRIKGDTKSQVLQL
jgi:hypothetical protein